MSGMGKPAAGRRPELAVDYYLQHFAEFLSRSEQLYAALFGAAEQAFVADFRTLPIDAQRLWLRMLSRKGQVFALSALQYAEISDQAQAVSALQNTGFAAVPDNAADLQDWWQKADKNRLWQLLQLGNFELASTLKKSADKAMLQQAVLQANLLTLNLVQQIEPLLALRRTAPLQYLLFLYFGRIEPDLSAFTLRDLGVLPTGGFKTEYQARFLDSATALTAYAYAGLRARLHALLPRKNSVLASADLATFNDEYASWPTPLDERTLLAREKLCYALGRQAEKLQLPALAIEWYCRCAAFPASERLLRLYQQQKMLAEFDALLEQMQSNPSCDDEYYVALDIASRQRKERRHTDLTVQLAQATVLQIDELYISQPEQGVIDHLARQGLQAVFAENNLWLALFGLLLWPQLFESEHSAIFNEFERRPRDLTSREFYQRQQQAIEQQLALLADKTAATQFLLAQLSRHYGKANSIFSWHSALAKPLLVLVQGAPAGALAVVLRKMAQDFPKHSSGYPDLLVWRDEDGHISALQLLEVKAPGDSVRRHQLSRLLALRQLGFAAGLVRLQWFLDPQRVYAVIDVETTGGQPAQDRITEIAIVKVQAGKVISEFSSLVNPGRRIPTYISKLTGITDLMVQQAPSFQALADTISAALHGCLFVAHNVRFDYGFVKAELARCDIALNMAQLCTVVESRRCFAGLESYSLANLSRYFKLELSQHHRALADARAAAQLLLLINEQRALEPPGSEI